MNSISKTQKALDKLDFPKKQKEGIVEVIDIKTDDAVSRLENKTDDAVSRLENKMDVGFKLLSSEIQCQNSKIDSIKSYITTTIGIGVLVLGIVGLLLKLWGK